MIQVVNDEVHNDDDLLQIIYYHSLKTPTSNTQSSHLEILENDQI